MPGAAALRVWPIAALSICQNPVKILVTVLDRRKRSILPSLAIAKVIFFLTIKPTERVISLFLFISIFLLFFYIYFAVNYRKYKELLVALEQTAYSFGFNSYRLLLLL